MYAHYHLWYLLSSQCGSVLEIYTVMNFCPFVNTTKSSLAAENHHRAGCQEMLTEICYAPFTVRKHNQITDICDVGKTRVVTETKLL